MSESLYAKLQSYALEKKDLVDHCNSEAQTRLTLINPYLELLGFDVRDPRRVRVEYETGIGKGMEKVDYAILESDNPIVLIEAKSTRGRLDGRLPQAQLRRYAIDSPSVRFAVLTNGVEWEWYYKGEDHRLIERPFLVVEVLQPKESDAEFLGRLSNNVLHQETIDAAKNAYLTTQFAEWLEDMYESPSDALLRLVHKELQQSFRPSQIDSIREHWMRACNQVNESRIHVRLDRAKQSPLNIPEDDVLRAETTNIIDQSDSSGRNCQFGHSDGRIHEFGDGTALLLYVLEYFAKDHQGGTQTYLRSVDRRLPGSGGRSSVSSDPEYANETKRYYSRHTYMGWRIFNNLSNVNKVKLIESLANECVRRDGSRPSRGRDFQVYLPNSGLSPL